jgi:peptidylprolyl isomerase
VRRLFVVSVVASVALGLGACSTTSSGAGSTGSGAGSTSSSGSTGGSGSTTTSGSPGTATGTDAQVPAVANATELSVAPVISAGTPPAPTTVVTKDLVVGTGATAAATSTVVVRYVGANFTDGKVFDSSWARGQPATFPLNGVIPGFAQGIVGMKVGGRRVIVIPPDKGYGANGSPPAVGPNETLVFVVDLVSVQ